MSSLENRLNRAFASKNEKNVALKIHVSVHWTAMYKTLLIFSTYSEKMSCFRGFFEPDLSR